MRDPLILLVMGGAVALAGLIWMGASNYAVPEEADVFSVVEGTWDWEHAESRCVADPVTISFSGARDTMFLTHREPVGWTDGTERTSRVTPDSGQDRDVAVTHAGMESGRSA